MKFKQLHKKYEWFGINVWDGKPFTHEEYKSRVREILKDREAAAHRIRDQEMNAKKAQALVSEVDDKGLSKTLKVL